ncbi:hypothetical protein ACJIZ3_019331 [Penstemon smallii]|uniref:non-specific serine/threonine protein kinase n=1 Tax=Penstemon smallii TaxID=265156 RepID=A0ABD3T0V2_9LAMI
MKTLLIPLLFFVIFILAIVYGAQSSSTSSDPDPDSVNPPLSLKPKHDRAIVAAPDGTVYFVEVDTGKVLWSFSSGPSIYSSFQQLPNHEDEKVNASADGDNFYIDCGEDWELYLHGVGLKKVKLPLSAEEFVKRTPFVSAGGGVMLGSKKTVLFLVDPKTGKVVRTIRSDNFPSVEEQGAGDTSILTRNSVEEWLPSTHDEVEAVEKPLYVTRTDYALKYTSAQTGKVLWYLMFADVEASFHCEGIETLFDGNVDIGLNKKLPIHCETRPVVYRIRDRSSLDPLIMAGKFQDALPGDEVLSLPAPGDKFMLDSMDSLIRFRNGNKEEIMLALPTSVSKDLAIRSLPSEGSPQSISRVESDSIAQLRFWPSVLYGALAPIIMALLFCFRRDHTRSGKLYKQSEDLRMQNATPKKKKSRKSVVNKHNISVHKMQENILQNDAVRVIDVTNSYLPPNFSDNNDSFANGRKIGKLIIYNKEIAKGSNGTIVLEGHYDGRPVAVKRLVRTHHDVAVKEIQNLIASDQHPNIVRWYGVEYDRDFIYISLERCVCSLHDLISFYASQNQITNRDQDQESPNPIKITVQLLSSGGTNKDFKLWKVNGYPSAGLLKLMRDIVCGLAHLHELGIIHRDLKPQNVLVIKDRSISAKISDMGISKRLDGDMSSLTKHVTGYGSSGWQAPEQLRNERQSRAVDLFSLGCILYFCITGGKHPFGENLERDVNIVNDRKDLFLIDNIPEATDLISRLLDSNPNLRPKAVEVSNHPLFWNSEMRLSFLRDVSDRVELEDRENASELLEALESRGKIALGGRWDEKMDTVFLNDIGRYRRYKFDSVRDLLRVIRNKLNHFRELSSEIQLILGSVPEGFDLYFSARFPKLLIEVYRIVLVHCSEEEFFQKYFRNTQL